MLGFLKHLLFPHSRNNHRAKILHHGSLAVIILVLLFSTFAMQSLKRSHPEILGISYSISANDLLNLVNSERQSRGLSPLQMNPALDDAARRKAADMFQKNYWAHFSPDGSTTPWAFIRAAGYNYQFAGENLAKGFTDAPSVVSAWMGSQSHRDNILSEKYKEIGFAIVPGTLQGEEIVLIVEMFGSAAGSPPATAAVPQTAVAAVAQESSPTSTPGVSPQGLGQTTPQPTVVLPTTAPPVDVPAPDNPRVENKPKIDSAFATRALSGAGLTFLVFGFLMDLIIVERKKIPRIVGHNLDHIILILTFILFLIVMKGGVIL